PRAPGAASPVPSPSARPARHPRPPPRRDPVRLCASDFCPPGIPGPVVERPWSPTTPYLRITTTEIVLARPDGSVVWKVPIKSRLEPDLVARGDFTGDGRPDLVFEEGRPGGPERLCAGKPMDETQLVFVDGASGASWRPVPPLLDLCWQSYGYATHQWSVGSVYIGELAGAPGVTDILIFPYW